ncbi:5'-methylthioadenosine/S-adenosylhomocysteine nucleosidase family protein, partial [Aspergillus glaucus CBS 516.65]
MPGMGKGIASSVATSFNASYNNIRLALLVGICGGVPRKKDGGEIFLGDVLVSNGLVQYDLGKRFPDKFFRKDTLGESLGRPNQEIRSILEKQEGVRSKGLLEGRLASYLDVVQDRLGVQRAGYPGTEEDFLFPSDYRHKHREPQACSLCDSCQARGDPVCYEVLQMRCQVLKCDRTISGVRTRIPSEVENPPPAVHVGLIASGDTVLLSGDDRDEISAKEETIGFEMEGAGVWDNIPCIVIKGVSDYADSHKSRRWQGYASAAAASCMKAFLCEYTVPDRFMTTISS